MASEEKISEVLARRLAHHGLLGTYIASQVCEAATEIAGGMFTPVSFSKGVLKVTVSTSGRGHLLKLKQNSVIEQINKKLNTKKVIRLTIVVGE